MGSISQISAIRGIFDSLLELQYVPEGECIDPVFKGCKSMSVML